MSAQYPTASSTGFKAADLLKGLRQRLKGPGGLYNLGNAIGFAGGLVAALITVPASEFGLSTALAAAGHYISGTPAALLLTIATVIFFWSGEQYHRAWSNGFPPDPAKNRTGDLSSALGAILLAGAFFALGNVLLALTAGLLHAAGKFGSAWLAHSRKPAGERVLSATLCREVVIVSRLPAAAMATAGLLSGDDSSRLVSAVLLVCCLVWAAADVMLLPPESRLSPRRYLASS